MINQNTIRNATKSNISDWYTEIVKKIPKQTNLYDCGVFVCQYAKYLSLGITNMNFSEVIYF